MFHQSNYVVVATRFLSAILRVLLVWPGVVLAIFGFMFFIATLGDDGGQRAASQMAATAQSYRTAPVGMVMIQPCPPINVPESKLFSVPSVAPVKKQDCRPYPKTFTDVAVKERRNILGIGSTLLAGGLLAELFSLLIRRRQMSRSAVYYGSINARGERNITLQSGETVHDKEGRHE
ncbi:hypothetical protein [Serratia marcescens]|uniref:hypothetical protein n=1 Tax=Serratia TaxID=613 RepID=UPI00044E362B|nr:hypothetical protein [Serratia marcescens]AVN35488.1 hypothetical protein AM470_19900 [Serratia marcescens]AVN48819.1 hypothetical protein AM478_03235 [Serratia marcescens]EZQ70047.1 hypothetical protein AF53_02933 [Serratia marcescens BIDMC 80]MBH2855429.1 hypothetical protein [Serratia marcescens]MBH3286748.1 hypothetical protein [Serratia marcescens]